MPQNINFYRSLPHESRYKLTPLLMGQLIVLFIIFLAIGAGASWIENSYYDYRISQLHAAQDAATKEIAEVAVRYPKNIQKIQLDNEVSALQQEVAIKIKLLAQLSQGGEEGNRQNLSDYLVSFSKAITPNVWLREMSIAQHGNQILLKGSTGDPVFVTQFIKNLGKQPNFAGKQFNTLRLSDSAEQPGITDFLLNTAGIPLPPPPPAKS